ncbi:hypothetical protein LZK80_33385 (plasmid) [Rhizobium leguminosarum]|nr:hypothetical protein LZK80_33385 [Rhizobium leguminosarum]UIL30292.1 hypothetical protein LZK75_28100 [Rhizobium leguminosarum]
MSVGQYKSAKTREIIEDAISQLCAVGFTPDGAAGLLVIEGMIRIEDRLKRKTWPLSLQAKRKTR